MPHHASDYQDHLGNRVTEPVRQDIASVPIVADRLPPPAPSSASDHARLATSIAWRFKNRAAQAGIAWEDLFQVAQVALAKAARSYKPAIGKFSTHAYPRIEGAIGKAIGRGLPAPVEEWDPEFTGNTGVAERTGIGRIRAGSGPNGEDDDRHGFERASRPARAYLTLARHDRARDLSLYGAMSALPAVHREILDLRFGLSCGQPRTILEIALALGLGRDTVRAVIDQALDTLRLAIPMEADDPPDVAPELLPLAAVFDWHLTRTHKISSIC